MLSEILSKDKLYLVVIDAITTKINYPYIVSKTEKKVRKCSLIFNTHIFTYLTVSCG